MSADVQHAAETVVQLSQHMQSLRAGAEEFLESHSARERGYFTPSEDDQIVQLWVSYHLTRRALLEQICDYQVHTSWKRKIELPDFAVAYAAAAVLVDAGRFLREVFSEEPIIRNKLNESYEAFAIPEGSFDAIQMSLTDFSHGYQLLQANRFLDSHWDEVHQLAADEPGLQGVVEIIDRLRERLRVRRRSFAKHRLLDRLSDLYAKIVYSGVGYALYSVQKWVSRRIGQMSFRPYHRPRLPKRIKRQLLELMQPGDVLVTRKEHCFTNYFLPGYWPHVALYIGDSQVIEALADGVRLRSVDSPFAVDSIAVIRPQLSPDEISTAVERAHNHVGKPYDFDFDFTRADRMVCTEVIYRSYEGLDGMHFQLTRRAGRQNLSAEDLLTLARQGELFSPVAIYCRQHRRKLLSGEEMENVLAKTMCC